jgi:hypothetical protein
VLLFDARTYDSIASVPVGLAPHEIAAAPDGRHLYVGNTGASAESKRYTITRIDVAEPTRTSAIDAGDCDGLHDLQVSRSGTLLWVGCARARAVNEIELGTGRLRRRWPIVPDGGWTLRATPDERRVYVAHLEGQAVSVIDRESGTASTVAAPGPQYGIDVLPGGREVWVAAADSGRVTVLDAGSGRVVAAVPSGGTGPGRHSARSVEHAHARGCSDPQAGRFGPAPCRAEGARTLAGRPVRGDNPPGGELGIDRGSRASGGRPHDRGARHARRRGLWGRRRQVIERSHQAVEPVQHEARLPPIARERYTDADHVEVEVRPGDLLEQGGSVYPVQSVAVERVWSFTLPSGSIEVREAT